MEEEVNMPDLTDHTVLYAMTSADGIPEGTAAYHEEFSVTEYLKVEGHELLRLWMPAAKDAFPVPFGICFYDSNKKLLKNRGVTMPYGRKDGEPRAVLVKIFVPKEAAWFRTTWWCDGSDTAACAELPFPFEFTFYADDERPFTHTLPTCTEMNNVIKRARQLTDIRWEPLVDVPRYCMLYSGISGQSGPHYLDWCKAGHTYTGIPYSGAGEPDRNTKRINPETFCGKWGYYKFHVGIDISFETFVTAARYPDSIFGERTGQTEPDFDSSPYGTYCSALVGYALGYQQPLPKVVEFCDSENFVKVIDRLPSLPPEEIRLCDIFLYGAFHISIVTDILHDGNGKVTGIEVSEATTVGNGNNTVLYTGLGGLCRRKMWKPEELYHWYQNYSLFRIVSFRGISYEKSEFVDVGTESNSMPVVDMPLIPYLGNGAKYKRDHIVNDRILIGASGFTEVVIEKDGEPFRTLSIEGKKYVNGGFSEEGSYTAYLSDGTVRTRACRWSVER